MEERHLDIKPSGPAIRHDAAVGAKPQHQAGTARKRPCHEFARFGQINQRQQQERFVRSFPVASPTPSGGIQPRQFS